MEFRLLEYVVAVSRAKSFTKAAQWLHMAQPSLSKQIKQVEEELGTALFIRQSGGIQPTPEGALFVEHAEELLQRKKHILQEMKERQQGVTGELTVGTTSITGRHVLPPLFKAYQQQYPHIRLRLIEASTEELHDLTIHGNVDVAISTLPVSDERLAITPMRTEPLYIVLPQASPSWMPGDIQAQKEAGVLSLSTVSVPELPFILLKQGYGFRQTVLDLCASHAFQPRIEFETSSVEMAQTMVGHGLGLTIVPEMVMDPRLHENVVYLPIAGLPTRTLAFVSRQSKHTNANVQSLIDLYI